MSTGPIERRNSSAITMKPMASSDGDDGRDPVIEAYKQHVDRTLLRENLKLTHQQRLEKLIALQEFARELRAAGEALRKGSASRDDD